MLWILCAPGSEGFPWWQFFNIVHWDRFEAKNSECSWQKGGFAMQEPGKERDSV